MVEFDRASFCFVSPPTDCQGDAGTQDAPNMKWSNMYGQICMVKYIWSNMYGQIYVWSNMYSQICMVKYVRSNMYGQIYMVKYEWSHTFMVKYVGRGWGIGKRRFNIYSQQDPGLEIIEREKQEVGWFNWFFWSDLSSLLSASSEQPIVILLLF